MQFQSFNLTTVILAAYDDFNFITCEDFISSYTWANIILDGLFFPLFCLIILDIEIKGWFWCYIFFRNSRSSWVRSKSLCSSSRSPYNFTLCNCYVSRWKQAVISIVSLFEIFWREGQSCIVRSSFLSECLITDCQGHCRSWYYICNCNTTVRQTSL